MLRTPVYKKKQIIFCDTVAIWRDILAWLAPARVTKVIPNYYKVINNGRIKSSGINRTGKFKTPTGRDIARRINPDDAVTV